MPRDKVDSAAKKHLQEEGYVVIPEVVSAQECDELIGLFQPWLAGFKDGESWNKGSWLLHSYHLGHFESPWRARLMVKDVFASLWGTDKLLTSFDGIAIVPPPETGRLPFRKPEDGWLHCDQEPSRRGLHAYQGALYLEETTPDDHCFRVMPRSHLLHEEFANDNRMRDIVTKYNTFSLNQEQLDWYKERGCQPQLVPVPKGGMVLWDSRTVHDSLKPREGRAHPDRWRYIIFICMEPAAWASSDVMEQRRQLYDAMESTGHWCTEKIYVFHTEPDPKHDLPELPEVARSREARLLAGVDQYDFQDGQPNGPEKPEWVTWD